MNEGLNKMSSLMEALTEATVLVASQVTVFRCISLRSFRFKLAPETPGRKLSPMNHLYEWIAGIAFVLHSKLMTSSSLSILPEEMVISLTSGA